jgi:hypothetical protein
MADQDIQQLESQFPTLSGQVFADARQRVLASGQSVLQSEDGCVVRVYPDGRKVYADTLKLPWVGEDGKVLGVVGVCRVVAAPAGEKPALDQ